MPITLRNFGVALLLFSILLLPPLARTNAAEAGKSPFQRPAPQQCSAGSAESRLWQLRDALRNNLTVIWIADPNFYLCWERVPINPLTQATILQWAANLKDALTVSSADPSGMDFELDEEHAPEEIAHFATYREMIASALHNCSAATNAITGECADKLRSVQLPSMMVAVYHMTMAEAPVNTSLGSFNFTLPLNNLKVTSIANFWRVVEATAAAQQLANAQLEQVLPTYARGFEGMKDKAAKQLQPRSTLYAISEIAGAVVILPRIVPMVHDESHQNVTSVFGHPKIWEVNLLISMLRSFKDIAHVTTVPSLEEYAVNGDKVKLHQMYQAYHAQDPDHRAPPIPTAFVRVPFQRVEALQLCLSSGFRPSEHLIVITMQALFEGMQELQGMVQQNGPVQRLLTTADADPSMQEYIIKREFAEGAIGLMTVSFPTSPLQEPHDAMPWQHRVANPFKDDGSVMGVRTSIVTTAQPLRDAALHIIKYSCGEGWLLQPKLSDFQKAEYRSIWPMKAKAFISMFFNFRTTISGAISWSHAVFLSPANAGNETEARGGKRVPWPSDKLHGMLVKAALDGARAIATSPEGPVLRTIRNVLIRVDIYMAMLEGTSPGTFEPVILINEMDWLNSAGTMIDLWDKRAPARMPPGNATAELHDALKRDQAKSVARNFARALLKEVVHSYMSSPDHEALIDTAS